jgi:heme/copper-type cytochrome/quinol oxidase subunit 2
MRLAYILILAVFLGLNLAYAHEAHNPPAEETLNQDSAGICPVMHIPASKKYSYTYEGKTYYFCCPECIEKFKNEPQKYIAKIKEIKVEVFQYGFSPDPLVVKEGDIVKLDVTSRDVTHGFYIKEYNINVAIKEGEHKKVEFFAGREGVFDIVCSVYCGPGHSEMKGKLIVEK